ncbi:MAG: hypothetical protein JW791_05165 [Nanoarchaeota archaeon]|nr:hypothetical protein [Nanoarchaeota archaeon]
MMSVKDKQSITKSFATKEEAQRFESAFWSIMEKYTLNQVCESLPDEVNLGRGKYSPANCYKMFRKGSTKTAHLLIKEDVNKGIDNKLYESEISTENVNHKRDAYYDVIITASYEQTKKFEKIFGKSGAEDHIEDIISKTVLADAVKDEQLGLPLPEELKTLADAISAKYKNCVTEIARASNDVYCMSIVKDGKDLGLLYYDGKKIGAEFKAKNDFLKVLKHGIGKVEGARKEEFVQDIKSLDKKVKSSLGSTCLEALLDNNVLSIDIGIGPNGGIIIGPGLDTGLDSLLGYHTTFGLDLLSGNLYLGDGYRFGSVVFEGMYNLGVNLYKSIEGIGKVIGDFSVSALNAISDGISMIGEGIAGFFEAVGSAAAGCVDGANGEGAIPALVLAGLILAAGATVGAVVAGTYYGVNKLRDVAEKASTSMTYYMDEQGSVSKIRLPKGSVEVKGQRNEINPLSQEMIEETKGMEQTSSLLTELREANNKYVTPSMVYPESALDDPILLQEIENPASEILRRKKERIYRA